ncbi:hypothetical protein HPP92_026145 [Vanilla planifolia]|uniref:Protein kinase domain-containing protein n=1 Tax=Vanilla planifolia TaxID=51239 RepID=A0A835U8Q6_VANPL|nr:hypothetical protein HPP92_026145 [Vanilla planifolia]
MAFLAFSTKHDCLVDRSNGGSLFLVLKNSENISRELVNPIASPICPSPVNNACFCPERNVQKLQFSFSVDWLEIKWRRPMWQSLERDQMFGVICNRDTMLTSSMGYVDDKHQEMKFRSIHFLSNLSGLGLTGSLGYQLSNLAAVKYFDLSKNNLHGDIPYQLPPNVVQINLGFNAFTGAIPYSISEMTDLQTIDLANNQLSGQLSNMFGKLPMLSELDLSFNRFSGNLPQSFVSLKSLKNLYLQNNQFTGSVRVLGPLHLDTLSFDEDNGYKSFLIGLQQTFSKKTIKFGIALKNIENNQFTGWIPDSFKKIGNVKRKSITSVHYIDESYGRGKPFGHEVGQKKDFKLIESSSAVNMDCIQRSASVGTKPPPSDRSSSFSENELNIKFNSRNSTEPINPSAMLLADLQAATDGLSNSRLVGEGSIGCVYKAKDADRKVLAVKKIDSSSLDFVEIISQISRLHHPYISELVGFCSESGYNILVYEYERNGSLHDYLHLAEEYSKPLTWDTRVKIALGTARAIEYLHEVCSPSTMHKNIKSSNILLDIVLNPHLSDCGLASYYQDPRKNLGQGYLPPEYKKPSDFTIKSDIYCFGVVMLELLTGRKPFDSYKPRAEQSLVQWATPQLHGIDALTQMVDPALRGLYPPKSLSRFADVIALTVQPEPEFRPPISDLVQALVCCVQYSSIDKKLGGDLSSSRRSDDSDYYY